VSDGIRALFLTVMPTPYWQDLFQAFRDGGGVRPSALYQFAAAPGTHWQPARLPEGEEVLPNRLEDFWGGRFCHHPSIRNALNRSDADVFVVGGYASRTCRVAMRWLEAHRKPWILFAERPGVRRRGRIAQRLRRAAMAPALRSGAAVAAVGSAAVAAYREIGFPPDRVANIPYFTDLRPVQMSPARAGQVPGRFRVLFCGQLIQRKGIDVLFSAFQTVAERVPTAELVVVGEGPLRNDLESHTLVRRGIARVIGFRPVAELPTFFADADLFVLPSRHDGWGVVVNQALAAGLPIVASDAVGAAQDHVARTGAGVLVSAGDATLLASAITRFATEPGELLRCAKAASDAADRLTLERGVEAWTELFENVLERSAPLAAKRRDMRHPSEISSARH
jgi:glycosyltransferase involved in cell wall biosynthesis